MLSRRIVSLVVIALVFSVSAAANRGITAEDYFAFQFISDARISPDGRQVAYVLTAIDQKKNRRNSSIWLVAVDGLSAPRRLTAEGLNSNSPRWSPDGSRLAFLSARNVEAPDAAPSGAGAPAEPVRPQMCILNMDGGEAQVASHLKNGVTVFQWSPDGKRFVAVSRVGPSDQVPRDAHKSDVRHYRHILYKFNDTGWYDDKRNHLWVVDAASGQDQQITSGDDWNDTDPQWSPDGAHIAFVSDRTGHEYDDSHNTDVWVISASGGALTKISDHAFEDDLPRWSPDGQRIVFAGRTTRRQFPKLYVADAKGGAPSSLVVDNLDLIPVGLHWGHGPNNLRFESGFKGATQIFGVDLAARAVTPVTHGERSVHAFDINEKTGLMT